MSNIETGQLWKDRDGHARVHGIVQVGDIAYAVMRRTRGATGQHKRRPFLYPVPSMLVGDDHWQRVPESKGDASDPAPRKQAYYETHEPPHCPTCDCGARR